MEALIFFCDTPSLMRRGDGFFCFVDTMDEEQAAVGNFPGPYGCA
jgi:hypothetical protein